MPDNFGERLVIVETQQRLHEKHCDERAARVADDISHMRTTNDNLSTEVKGAVTRIHTRVDEMNLTVAGIKSDVAAVAEGAKAAVREGMSNTKLWTYAQMAALLGLAATIYFSK